LPVSPEGRDGVTVVDEEFSQMLREIVLDTETTGTDPAKGDRVIEIGCVEMLNHIPTGKSYHVYINPERPVSPGAFAVHGLSDEFLADKPVFAAIADEFADFVGDARLVIHNAAFDIGFLNAELARTGHRPFNLADAVDTLSMARRKHPGAANNLDALCTRYGIDNSRRTKHGALLDAEILAEVYIELIGGRQVGFDLSLKPSARIQAAQEQAAARDARPRTLISRLTDAERAAHEAFIRSLGENAIWREYLGKATPEAS
jgi:DNA polymerase-3 subunit epsilon